MMLTSSSLDKNVKSILSDRILEELFKKYRHLPLPNETDKILGALTDRLVSELNDKVKEYYNNTLESSDIDIALTKDDYLEVYLNRI
jgi:hypothetical protein